MNQQIQPSQPTGIMDQRDAEGARRILDHFDVVARLTEIRDFIWRGGQVRFEVDRPSPLSPRLTDIHYALTAVWDTARLRADGVSRELVTKDGNQYEGFWERVQTGYSLRVGIDVSGAPTAIYVRSSTYACLVPYLDRPSTQVENALAFALGEYRNEFLAKFKTVPVARETEALRIKQYGI